jgi:nitrate/TMAO reductase-like tetraheme cytochrome c subunit
MRITRLQHAFLGAIALPLVMGTYVTALTLERERPEVRPSTLHPTLTRDSCVECHAPIAEEWAQSVHFRSVTGPFWEGIRTEGYADLFETLRVPCMNCHAPANVLDLVDGARPAERLDQVELGVDCVSCHVSERGIVGPGRYVQAPHEVLQDPRFRDPVMTTTDLCGRCHEEQADCNKTVTDWSRTAFADQGLTCLHCHMPEVEGPLVVNGPPKMRRSHRFVGDKDVEMLRAALSASISIEREESAVVRIVNDRVGHSFPASGMNWLFVNVKVEDESGLAVAAVERGFGSRELLPGYLDFWPFLQISRIPYGETREIRVDLPAGHGVVSAEFRYRDWFSVEDQDLVFATLREPY